VTEPVPPLDSELRSLLRAESPAPAAARERVRARLAASVPGMLLPDGSPARSAALGMLGGLRTGALVLAAFVLGGVAGAVLFAAPPPEAQVRFVYVDRPAPPVVALAPEPVVSPPPAPEPVESPPAEAPTPTAAPRAETTAAPRPEATAAPRAEATAAPQASQLAAERVLLDEARAALVQGEPERSIELLSRHASRFPAAILGEERDAMQVEALVAAGRIAEARAHADSFRAQRPNSLFLATVNSAIASIPPDP
jgi:hypothetical protein